jgi:hypothetical protein
MTALATLPLARRTARIEVPAATRRVQARNAVAIGFLIAAAAHVWLAVRVETDRPHWRDPEFFHRARAAATLVRTQHKPLLAILGGSRSQMGLNPERLGDSTFAFNFAQSGCLPVGEWLNFTRLADAGLKPDAVLVEILPPVLADPGPMEDRIPPVRLSREELERLKPFHEHPEAPLAEWRQARLNPWFTLRVPLLANAGLAEMLPAGPSQGHRNWSAMSSRGWSPGPPRAVSDADRDSRTALARQTYAWLLIDFTVQDVNDRAFRRILAVGRERGIRIAFFLMPESPLFRSWYPAAARQIIRDYLQTLGAPVFDASAWFDDEAAFLDGHHLQREAAEAFSERFGRECVKPWMARTP